MIWLMVYYGMMFKSCKQIQTCVLLIDQLIRYEGYTPFLIYPLSSQRSVLEDTDIATAQNDHCVLYRVII